MKIKSLNIFATLLLPALILSACGEPAGPKPEGKYAEVAKCLTTKGVIMYGAYWCPHCQTQKKMLGDDVQFIKYQECDDAGTGGNHKLCVEKGVTSYPTWIFPGQGSLTGEQEVFTLAKLANCVDKLPQEDKDKLKAAEDAATKANSEKTSISAEVPVGNVKVVGEPGKSPIVTATSDPIVSSKAPETTSTTK